MKKKNGNGRIEILIVEDSPTQSAQLQYLLEGRGYTVVATANGRQALEAIRRHRPSLVVSDIVMPEMDGYQLCKAIKSDETLKDIPVILVTTLSDIMDIMRGLECGADNFIRKPYAEKYLLARVDYLLMNQEIRKGQKMQMGMEIHLGGRRHFITAERQQILDLLISVYDEAVHLNEELKVRQSELADSNRALNGLYHIAEGLNHSTSEREVCDRALEHALELPGVQSGWISLREGDSDFRLAGARNLPPALQAVGAMEGLCECRSRLLAGKLDHVTNIMECERLSQAKTGTQGLRYHASVPLWNGDQILGIMNLVGSDQGMFKEEELETLYGVGHQVGIALERVRLHEHLERLVAERTAKLEAEVEERKRIQEDQARLVAIIEATPDLVSTVAPDGRLLYANQAGLRMLGIQENDLSALHIQDIHPQWARKRVLEEGIAHAIGNGVWSGETALLDRAGHEIPALQVIIAHKDNNGGLKYLSTMMRDITDRKRTEEALRASEARLRAIIEAEPECVKVVDTEGRVVQMNAAGLAMIDADSFEQVRGNSVIGFVSPEQREAYGDFVADVLAGQRRTFEFEIASLKGKHRWLESHAVPLYEQQDGDGRPLMLAITRDITERRQAETTLLQLNESLEQRVVDRTMDLERARHEADDASRAKSSFLSTMSHEIRTPMNGVVGMVDVLAQSRLSEHQADLVKTIKESANTLLGLIDDILDFSKIEAGRLELEQVPVSIADLVEGLCNSLLPVANRKGVELSTFISPDIPEQVLSDDTRLRQVLYNLVGNAIKFAPRMPGKRAQVSVRVEMAQTAPLRLALRVSDNGIGMAPETLTHLFTPFTQAEVSTTRRFGGTGLGLAICKRLVDLMDGEISVQSTLGVGSTFTATLPFEVPAEQPVRTLPDLTGLECIMLESPDIHAGDLRAYLEHAGAKVHLVADAATAVRTAEQLPAPVTVILAGAHGDMLAALRTSLAAMPDVRYLLITHGRRRRSRIEGPNTTSIDGDALRRFSLLRAVAVTAGRASPEIFQEQPEKSLATEAPPPTIDEARAQGRLILVAEDDEINQKVILQQLRLLGYAAEIAATGVEALRLWRAGRYALLLTDLHMPEMDGYTLAETIRREETGRHRMPIVVLTANALRGEANRALALGMDGYLTKPVQLHLLRSMLEQWLPGTGANPPPASQTAPSMAPASAAAVDVSVLQSLVGHDTAIVREFLADYLASARHLAGEMRAALADGDIRHASAIAHKLKSSSRAMGALALGDLCAELENSGKAADKPALAQGMAQFEIALAKVETEITVLLEKQ